VQPLIILIGKIRKYIFYFFIFLFIITLVYLLSLYSFKKVEELVSYRVEISRIYEKWLVVKSDALSYLKSDKQENIKAKLNQSLEIFERDFLFFSRTEFNALKKESPEIFENSRLLINSWQRVQKNIREILQTDSSFENFSRQIYWISNDTVVFEQHLKELLFWFDSYNRSQMLFHWRSFYFFAVVIILASLLAARLGRKYLKEKIEKEKTLDLMHSIVSERESERLKIALEIHDTIIQDLTFSRMLCRDLSDSLLRMDTQLKLDELTKIIMKAIKQIREITYDLMPPELGNNNIESIFSNYCRNFMNKSGINTILNVTGFKNIRINDSQRLTLYRILQECLTNSRKHSGAKNISVKLLLTYPYIIFRASDDGKGIDQNLIDKNPDQRFHFGLKGIQERVAMFDGETNIKNIPGRGFSIRIKMKLREIQDEKKLYCSNNR